MVACAFMAMRFEHFFKVDPALLPAALVLYRIGDDGRLSFARKIDVDTDGFNAAMERQRAEAEAGRLIEQRKRLRVTLALAASILLVLSALTRSNVPCCGTTAGFAWHADFA